MKKEIKKVESEIEEIENDLRSQLKKIGSGHAAKLLNMHQPDIALFIAGSRKFSLKKMKKIYEKIEKNNNSIPLS